MANTVTLFENQSSDGFSSIYEESQGGIRWLKLGGNFDGATVDLQLDFGDNNFVNVSNYQFTSEDAVEIKSLKPGIRLRLKVSSSGGSTSITAKLL